MMNALRRRFWLEGGLGVLTAVLFAAKLRGVWYETFKGYGGCQGFQNAQGQDHHS